MNVTFANDIFLDASLLYSEQKYPLAAVWSLVSTPLSFPQVLTPPQSEPPSEHRGWRLAKNSLSPI